jgi:hypothetical protein
MSLLECTGTLFNGKDNFILFVMKQIYCSQFQAAQNQQPNQEPKYSKCTANLQCVFILKHHLHDLKFYLFFLNFLFGGTGV